MNYESYLLVSKSLSRKYFKNLYDAHLSYVLRRILTSYFLNFLFGQLYCYEYFQY